MFDYREKELINQPREHWDKLGKKRVNKEKRESALERNGIEPEDQTDQRIVSNNPNVAPLEYRMEHMKEPPKSHIREAMERDISYYVRYRNASS